MKEESEAASAGAAEANSSGGMDAKGLQPNWKWLWVLLAVAAVIGGWKLLFRESADPATALNQSLRYAQEGRYQECIDAAQRVLKIQPGSAAAYNNIGWCWAKLGNWDEGIRNTAEALHVDPKMAAAANNLKWMLGEQSKPASAASPADAELNDSLANARAGRYQECIDAARRVLKIQPNSAPAYNNIGWCYAKLGNWSEGVENLQQALKIQPESPTFSNNLRWAMGEQAKAAGQPPAR
jgi:tetratricopeptide (TPR) repeat protein